MIQKSVKKSDVQQSELTIHSLLKGDTKKILVLEDDAGYRALETFALKSNGFLVESYATITAAVQAIYKQPPDLAVFDIRLPDGEAIPLLKNLRKEGYSFPIILVTALETIENKIEGFNCGADDYLTKPFEPRELVVRVRALLRRLGGERNIKMTYGGFTFDSIATRIFYKGKEINLKPKEFSLLKYLAIHEPQILSPEKLLQDIWGLSFDPGTKLIAVCLSRLRKILNEEVGFFPIHTIYGKGYTFQSNTQK